MDSLAKQTLIPDQLTESDLTPDSFFAVPRDSDTAVVYWSLKNRKLPFHEGGRLCLRVTGQGADSEETIILYRESGHFIIPLINRERRYEIQLGWSDINGFAVLFSEKIVLPDLDYEPKGAYSTAIDHRASVFWGKGASAN